ncbi:MAG TPA: hypothetical protein VF131_12265 [Blastocatellia bacterium]|nr:hypothetical protein [Blastocatellia bacterium]
MKRVMGILLAAALAAGVFIATVVESTPPAADRAAPAVVYVTREHGKKFHAQECAGLKRARGADITSLSREDAESAGYLACGDCFRR